MPDDASMRHRPPFRRPPSSCSERVVRRPAGAGRRARRRRRGWASGLSSLGRRSSGSSSSRPSVGPSSDGWSVAARVMPSVLGRYAAAGRTTPEGWRVRALRPAAGAPGRAGAARSRGVTAWPSPSRGKGHSPSASAWSAGTPRRGQVADRLRRRSRSRCAAPRRSRGRPSAPCPGTTTVSAADQVEHHVEGAAATPAGSSRRRTPGGAALLDQVAGEHDVGVRRPAPPRRRRCGRARGGPARPAGRRGRGRGREEKVWSAGTISVSSTSSRCGSSSSSAYRSLIRSPASTVRSAATSWAWIGTSPYAVAEGAVAEGVVEVLVGVDDRRHRRRRRGRGRRRRSPAPPGPTPGCRRPAGRPSPPTRQTLTSNHSCRATHTRSATSVNPVTTPDA